MPIYAYKVRDNTGKALTGTMEGPSREEIAQKLRKMGYLPVSIEEGRAEIDFSAWLKKFERIKVEDLIIFYLQLANMLEAGLTLLSSLQTISKQIENKKFKEIIEDISLSVSSGSNFSDSLAKHPGVFSKLFINTVRAGEVSGHLTTVLNRLAAYVEKQEDLRQKVKSALTYPMVLLCVGIFVILVIVTFVMPQFVDIFNRAKIPLPVPTQILYAVGMGIKNFWYLVILGVGFISFGFKLYARSNKGRLQIDRFILKIKILGPLIRRVVIARFSRTLSTLMASGVPLLQAFDILRDVVGNEVFSRVIVNVRTAVENGEKISQPLKISEEFPPDAVQMMIAGEESGQMPEMLDKIADFYESAVGYSIKKLTSLIEPFFVVVMAVMVGFIMASMLLPIFDMVKTLRH